MVETLTALMERRAIRIFAYVAFTCAAFFLCLTMTLPDERLKQIVIVQLERQLNAGKDRTQRDARIWEVQIDDMDLWWLSGLEFHNVVLREKWSEERKQRAIDEAKEGAPPQKPLTVTIPRLAARGSLLQSIVNVGGAGVFEVDFNSGSSGGGMISGVVVQKTDGVLIKAELEELDMYRTALLESVTGVPGFGKLDGTIELALDPKTRQPSSGKVALRGEKLSMGPATVKTDKLPSMAYLEVPRTSLGTLKFDGHIETKGGQPSFVFDEFSANGLDIRMEVWGDMALDKVPAKSRSNVEMRMMFAEDFVKENSLGPILNIQTLRSGRNGEGWYGMAMKGQLGKLRPEGSLKAARGPQGTGSGEAGAPTPAAAPDDEAAMREQEARQKARESRRQKIDPEAEEAPGNFVEEEAIEE